MSRLMEIEEKNPSLVAEYYLIHSIQEKICELMDKKGISQTKLANLVGVSKSEISRLLSEDRNLNIRTISKIFSALGEELKVITKSEYSGIAKSFTIDRTSAHVQWHNQNVTLNMSVQQNHGLKNFRIPTKFYGTKNAK